jgi:CRP-like cAMP-binding protein
MSILDTHKVDFKILDRPDMPVTRYAAGDTILQKGAPAKEMFLLRKGKVAIKVGDETVEEIGQGGIFGEMALIDGSPRAATARARTACEVAPITEKSFLFLVHETPYFAIAVMRTLAERLRRSRP